MKNLDSTETVLFGGTKAPQAGGAEAPRSLYDLDELIGAACAGDRAALNRLLAHARPRLVAVAMRIVRDRDDAEDVVQEALLKVCRSLTRFEGRSAFSTWLHRIVVNAGPIGCVVTRRAASATRTRTTIATSHRSTRSRS